ncbi:phage portal protein [Clostridium akagii]|uniref:phage portal protein n=1 Tax=Clostridium akagii TaxID=91623 RepID=UPI00068C4498|nr:phage portal protein [Clostridium akagii]
MNEFQQKAAKLIFGKTFQEKVSDFLTGNDLEGDSTTGFNIDKVTAMKYSAVFGCVRVLGETFANTPAMLYRKDKNGERKETNDLAIYDILHNEPNSEMSPFNFKEMCMNSLNLGGNSVSQRLLNRKGELIGLYPYVYDRVEIHRDINTKKLIYTVDGKKDFSREEVLHIPGISFDGIVGLTPIEYAASAIRLGISYEQFGVNFYKNGANSTGAFKSPGVLEEVAFNRLKKELKTNYTGLKNTGTPMILEDGLEFQPFQIKPVDAQLLESKYFQIEDICRIYRVPQHLVNKLDRSTNNNIEQQSLEFVMYTMLPWFKRWEDNVNMQLLTREQRQAGYYLEFKADALLRGDIASRATYYAQGRQWGWLSVNDIHRLENMPSIGEPGNIYLQPLNMGKAGDIQTKDQLKAMTEAIYNTILNKNK